MLIILILDFPGGNIEVQFQYIFKTISLSIGIAGDGLPLIIHELFSGQIFDDEVGVQSQHRCYEYQKRNNQYGEYDGEGVRS